MDGRSQAYCAERDRLRTVYGVAVSAWIKAGGTDSNRVHIPPVVDAKEHLDRAVRELIEHRKEHGC